MNLEDITLGIIKARHKSSGIIQFHLYEMPRTVKLIETESRSVVARGWQEAEVSSDFLMSTGFL